MSIKKKNPNSKNVLQKENEENESIEKPPETPPGEVDKGEGEVTASKGFEEVNIAEKIDEETPEASQEPLPIEPKIEGENDDGENDDGVGSTNSVGGFGDGVPLDFILGGKEQETSSSRNVGDDIFDPSIHCVNSDGSPRKTKSGKYRLRPGRKPPEQIKAEKVEVVNRFMETPPAQLQGIVTMGLGVVEQVLIRTLGEKWRLSFDESTKLVDVYARYLHYKDLDTFVTPEMMVIGTTLLVFGPRILDSGLIGKFFGNKKKTVQNHAYSNNRTNDARENDAGESDSPTVTDEQESPDFRSVEWEVGQPSVM